MILQEVQEQSLRTSAALSRYYMPDAILPKDVIRVLNRERISFVLVGAHGAFGWMNESRATEDVDIIVASKHHKKAVKVLLIEFPDLEAYDHEVVTRLRDRVDKRVRIDVMKPVQSPHREIFKNAETVGAGEEMYRVPSLEMSIVLKFAQMISLTRADEDKYQDAHDFIKLVKVNPNYDREKLAQLGDLVYSGGGAEVVELARRALAGEKLNL